MAELVKICRTVCAKDSKVVLNMGLQEVNELVICECILTTDAEQVRYRFQAKKPEDFTGATDPIAVNAVKFMGIAESVLAFKEDVYLSLAGTMLEIGASNKAKSSVAIEAQAPALMPMTDLLFRFMIEGKALSSVLTKGCSFTGDKELHSAIVQLIPEKNILRGYSTDGNSIGRAEGKANFLKTDDANEKNKAQAEQMQKALEAVCDKNGLDKTKFMAEWPLIIPAEAIQHLGTIIQGAGKVLVNVDENHIHVLVGNSLVYSITQASSTRVPIPQIEAMAQDASDATYCIDAARLSEALGFINKNNAIGDSADMYTSVSVSGEDILVSSGKASQYESRVKAIALDGAATLTVDGEKFKKAVDTLSRGNMLLGAYGRYVTLFNGTKENKDHSSFVILMQVNPQQFEEATAGTSDDATAE